MTLEPDSIEKEKHDNHQKNKDDANRSRYK